MPSVACGMLFGQVDKVGKHYIATNFVALCIPLRSTYVTSESSERIPGGTKFTWTGVPVKLNAKSIALGLVRVWAPLIGCAMPFITHWGENVADTPRAVWLWPLGGIALALVSLALGRLPQAEQRRLRVLGMVTGVSVDPSKLDEFTRSGTVGTLEVELRQAGLPVEPAALELAAQRADKGLLPQIYTYAVYQEGAAWKTVAQRIYKQLTS